MNKITKTLCAVKKIHDGFFDMLLKITNGWFLGLFARFTFASVLYFYFLSSAKTKVGEGFWGFFSVQDGAYYQIAYNAVEAAGGEVSAVSFLPWGMMVYAGTYAEFILPLMVIFGLFARFASLGMIGFIAVQTLVDLYVHQLDQKSIGVLFDRFPDSIIMDQRLLWVFPLMYIAIKGAGWVSLDALASRIKIPK